MSQSVPATPTRQVDPAPTEPGESQTVEERVKELANKSDSEPLPAELKAIFHPFQGDAVDELEPEDDAEVANAELETDRKGLLKRLKDFIGSDLTRVTIPVWFNEPTSFLHRMAEACQFYEFLDKAAAEEDPYLRMVYVTAYSIVRYSVGERVSKPFNPLLGETLEWITPTTRFVAEQVSHHPPICAGHMEAKNWEWWEYKCVEAKFTGNAVVSPPLGDTYVKLHGETYTWPGLTSCLHNLIVGRMWIDHYGQYIVKSEESPAEGVVDFTQCGWFSRGWHEVKAVIKDENKKAKYYIGGKWHNNIVYWDAKHGKDMNKVPATELKPLWTKQAQPSKSQWPGFDAFVEGLCELNEQRKNTLPRSDARWRPDILELARFNYRIAGKEKRKLEEKQREERRLREAGTLGPWQHRWFEQASDGKGWNFKGDYWTKRTERLQAKGVDDDAPQFDDKK